MSGVEQAAHEQFATTRFAGVFIPAFVERLVILLGGLMVWAGFAGVFIPAFVERPGLTHLRQAPERFAGVFIPAFVERLWRPTGLLPVVHQFRRGVHPGLR